MRDQSEHSSTFSYLKHPKITKALFVTITKPLSNKIGETFREGLK